MCPHCKTKFSIPWETPLAAPPIPSSSAPNPSSSKAEPANPPQKTSDRLKKMVQEEEEEPMLLEEVEEPEQKTKTKSSSNFEVIEDDDDEDKDEEERESSKPKNRKPNKNRRPRDEDEDVGDEPPIWRAQEPKKKKKDRGHRSRRRSSKSFFNVNTTTLLIGVVASFLGFVGSFIHEAALALPFAVAFVVNIIAGIWFVIVAWNDQPFHVFACYLLPGYSIYYLITRFDMLRGSFFLGLWSFVIAMLGVAALLVGTVVHEARKSKKAELTFPNQVYTVMVSQTPFAG